MPEETDKPYHIEPQRHSSELQTTTITRTSQGRTSSNITCLLSLVGTATRTAHWWASSDTANCRQMWHWKPDSSKECVGHASSPLSFLLLCSCNLLQPYLFPSSNQLFPSHSFSGWHFPNSRKKGRCCAPGDEKLHLKEQFCQKSRDHIHFVQVTHVLCATQAVTYSCMWPSRWVSLQKQHLTVPYKGFSRSSLILH